jgi:hypothetical protein
MNPRDFPTYGAGLIAEERARQIHAEGWTLKHDKDHTHEELVLAAIAYALPKSWRARTIFDHNPERSLKKSLWRLFWPWREMWWKPSGDDRVRDLVKAGALIAAEIDRLQAVRDGT